MLEEQAFDPGRHDREDFACGVPGFDAWLQRFATRQRRKGISTVFVLVDSARPSTILGYCSLSAAELDSAALSQTLFNRRSFLLGDLRQSSEFRNTQRGQIIEGWIVICWRTSRI